MRTISYTNENSIEALSDDDGLVILDGMDGVAETLDAVDGPLSPHGLEIVMIETQGDYFLFRVAEKAHHPNMAPNRE